MKKLLQLMMAVLLLPVCLWAQQKTISGKVQDQNGNPLTGVTVSVNDNSGRAGAVTDAQGSFSITVPQNTTELLFSMVGMKPITEKIGNRSVINLTMASGENQLTDVVVVGYGARRRETLTGAITSISNKDIQTTTNISLAQKLQGKVAGLQIRQLSGEPGTFENSIRIRGYGNNPLYVIDGVVRDGSGEFQRLNPDDIESISFLKDASAAIFGFGSADGVIIVTTKKGGKGKAAFTYNGVVGWSSPTDVPRMANASEWMQMRNEADIYGRGAPFIPREELQKWIDGVPGYESTDWYNVAFKGSSTQTQHNLSASGGSEKTQYYIGLAYVDEQSLLKTNDMGYKRYNLRANITTELIKNLRAEVLVGGRYDKRYTPGENFFNIFKGTRVTLPTEKPYVNNNPGYLAEVTPSNQNPLALTDKNITGYSESVNRNVQTTASLTWTVPFVKGLSIKGLAAYDLNSSQGKDVSKPYTLYACANGEFIPKPQRSGQAGISNSYGNSNRLNLQLQANYGIAIADRHNIAATAVFEQRQDWGRDAGLRRLYDFYTIDQIDFASENGMTNSGREWRTASQSVLGRVNYDFDKKYLLELAFRYMGTYAFPPESRWGFFPIVSAGWRMSEEKFIQTAMPFVNNLKLRASYGEVASSDNANPFQWIPGFGLVGGGRYEFENGSLTNGATSPGIVNPSLTWVNAKTSDIGIDIGLWNNKLTFEFDVFRRDLEGIPAYRSVSIPNTFGASLPQENLNSARTQGLEFTIGHNNTVGAVNYGVSANFGYSRTKNLYVESAPFTNSWERWKNGTANRYNDIVWGYTYAGQFLTEEEIHNYALQNGDQGNLRELPGDFKFVDNNNDGMVDDKDMLPQFIGQNGTNDNQNPLGKAPKINYGMTLYANYKGFDVNLLFQGAAMYTVRFNEVYAEVLAFRGNTPAYFFDRWHKADPYDLKSEWIPGKWPAARFIGDVGSMYKESSIWRKDASYLRLKSVELGYTLNPSWYKVSGIQKIRVYANGFNLLTFADEFVKPFDPERLEGLFNAGFNYPLSKIYNVGINVTF
jgi:TonB-linked SusC/RagA family outer membrane protein